MSKMNKKKNRSEITLKISAVVIAIILWVFVMSLENPTGEWEYRNIDVSFNNMESLERNDLIIMSPQEASVSVTVSGRRLDRGDFSEEDIKAEVDLSGYSEGDRKVPIKVSLEEESTMKITDWEPREVLFKFDKIIEKDKDVSIKTQGELPEGYVLGDISTESQSITLKGPRTWVEKVAEIVATIDLTDRKEDIKVTAPIRIIDEEGNDVLGVDNEPNVIDVTISVYRTVTVPIEIQTVNELPENFEVTDININPSSISLKGDHTIANLNSIQTKPIDINSFMQEVNILVELDLPENVTLLNPNETVTVSLKIEEDSSNTFEFNLEEIEKRNLNPELNIELEDDTEAFKITLSGEKSLVEALSKEDLEVYMDFTDLEEGEHEISIEYNIPENIEVNDAVPQTIKLNLINELGR